MNDLPSTMLLQQSLARPVSGEELESLGKQAASAYLSGACSLNRAVIDTVKHAGLSPEQVCRVVEFANTDAYLTEFKKEGQHRVVDFAGGPADPSVILKDLNDGGGGTVVDRGSADYRQPPPDFSKFAADNQDRVGVGMNKLAEAFGVDEQPIPYAEPLRDAYDTYVKLGAAHDRLNATVQELESTYMSLSDRLFERVKEAALAGTTLGQIVGVWSEVVDDPDVMKIAFAALTPRLLENRVFESRDQIGESLEKAAAIGPVNRQHPLIVEFDEFAGTLQKMAAHRLAREEVAEALDSIGTFLKTAKDKMVRHGGDRVSDAAEMLGKAVGGGWKGVTGATARASVPVQRFGEAVAGPLAGKLMGGAVKYAPHIGLGVGAEEVYQRAKYMPSVQATKNFILSRIPYTHPHMVRQYELQMQGGLI